MTSKEKAKKLYEIVDVLKEFKEYTKGRTDQATRNTPKARQLVRKAMTLLADNLKLLNECKNKYGCHSPLQECFECIEQAASFLRTKDLGDYSYWVCNFCKPRLWDGVKRSFADECMRYANEVDREINEQKVIISLGEYESEHGNKIGISPADLEREVEMTWPQLRPVLDRLGRKGLIEGHKGDGYTSYWLSVEFDENDSYKHQCSVKEFRLTQQGQKLYGKIAEKPAKTEQENKDTKSELVNANKPTATTRFEGYLVWFKENKVISILLVLAIIIIAFGSFTDALKKIRDFWFKPNSSVKQEMNISPTSDKDLSKPIVVASATVEVKITSDWDFDGTVASAKAYLAFVKNDKPLLITSKRGYTASQTGNDEVVYKAKLDMDAKDTAVGNPTSFLKDAEYIQIEFGRMPPDSLVLEGDVICIINNSVRLEFSIPPQKLVNNRIFIRNLSESLRVLNEPGN